MEELLRSSGRAMAAAVAAREVSPIELLDAHIARIEELNPRLNALVLPDLERARETAGEAERALSDGQEIGPLHGVPFTAKETVEVAGMPACGASRIFEGHVSTITAPVLERLRAAGAIFLGKTNIPEFALGYDADNLVYGATGNPHDPARSVGGSSGGEAAAISAGMSAFGIGSDYGGSVRVPAHYCGCVALKPGRGGAGYSGFFPAPLPLSVRQWTTAGPMARRVEDLELLMPLFGRADPGHDPDVPPRDWAQAGNLERLRVAYFEDDGLAPVSAACRQAARGARKALEEAGFAVAESSPPNQEAVREVFLGMALAEMRVGLVALIGDREDQLSPQTRHMLERYGDLAPSLESYVGQGIHLTELERQAGAWLEEHPIAICPVSSTAAPEIGATSYGCDGGSVDMTDAYSLCTYVNAMGLPAATVPARRTGAGLPVGVQVIGRRYRENEVLAVARVLEEALGGWREPEPARAGARARP